MDTEERLTAAMMAYSKAIEAVNVLVAGMGGHDHCEWSMQHGAGCQTCIGQRDARERAAQLIRESADLLRYQTRQVIRNFRRLAKEALKRGDTPDSKIMGRTVLTDELRGALKAYRLANWAAMVLLDSMYDDMDDELSNTKRVARDRARQLLADAADALMGDEP